MPGPVFLEGERVTLCPVAADDLDFLARNHNEPAVRRWMPRVRPMDREAIREEYLEAGDGDVHLLVCSDDVERLGFCALFDVEPNSGRAEVGVWLAPGAQGRGYATAALETLVEYAFTDRRFHRLNAGALATNDRSRALLDRLGFREEGRRRDYYFVGGEYVDRVVYGLLESEWGEDC